MAELRRLIQEVWDHGLKRYVEPQGAEAWEDDATPDPVAGMAPEDQSVQSETPSSSSDDVR